MTDDQILQYLRSRGRAEPPRDLVHSVMVALDEGPPVRSWFSAYIPAAAVAGGLALIVAVAFLIGQGPNVGPDPSPLPSSESVSVEELRAAVTQAVETLREAPGVQGVGTSHIRDELARANWFDWRANGDQVVVQRDDIDVAQTAWWLDPDGEPPTRRTHVTTTIRVVVGDDFYLGAEGGWTVEDVANVPPVLSYATAILDGSLDPWQPPTDDQSGLPDGEATSRVLADGSRVWVLRMPYRDGAVALEWRVTATGSLASWSVEQIDVSPPLDASGYFTTQQLAFTRLTDPAPISTPDLDGTPDPAEFGLPSDFPLDATEEAAVIDYREYVEVALDALEMYHWNSDAVDWTAARSAALNGLPDDADAGQAHQRIRNAIQTFDFFNTVFVRPEDVPTGGPEPGPLPTGERIGEVGYIALPSSTGGPDAVRDYLRAARLAMERVEALDPACGWIVDVRGTSGGAFSTLFSAVGGLLGEGRAITFNSRLGNYWIDVDDEGTITLGGDEPASDLLDSPLFAVVMAADEQRAGAFAAVLEEEPSYVPAADDPPVVVLTSTSTSGAGEQLVVGFQGRPLTRTIGGVTAGSPHGLVMLEMADGAQLRIPTATVMDRSGTVYTENLFPDEIAASGGPSGDAAIDAAVDWLNGQPGCS